jgi:type IV fimbrial biogenesis protein FimT
MPRDSHCNRAAAFTLVECVVALAIAGIVFAIALPSFQDWLGAYRLNNHARHLAESMTRARTEAIRRGHRVALCKSSDGRQCDDAGSWEHGFVIFADVNDNGRIDADEPLLEIGESAPPGVRVTANRPVDDYVSYTSVGHARMLNGALQMGTLTLCLRGQRAVEVVLAASGRARIEQTQNRCS